MKKTAIYHVCLSSHNEVFFRSEADLRMGFNCLAAAILSTESRLFADGFMTTHYHVLLQTSSLKEVLFRTRNAYSRYFNTKYSRTGRLGESHFFNLTIEGLNHTIAALNYVIRQGLHHGLSTTPFGYPFCSANSYFRQDLGKVTTPALLPDWLRYKYLPSNVKIPVEYRMSSDGQLLREDILDTSWVEQNYITPRNFLFQMNRIADENDTLTQQKENKLPPVTIETIEAGVPDFVLTEAKSCEYGKVNRSHMTDLELCSLIDRTILPKLVKSGQDPSIYLLTNSKREELCEWMWNANRESKWKKESNGIFGSKFVTEGQLRRCLACTE
jgi:hypothetical protein